MFETMKGWFKGNKKEQPKSESQAEQPKVSPNEQAQIDATMAQAKETAKIRMEAKAREDKMEAELTAHMKSLGIDMPKIRRSTGEVSRPAGEHLDVYKSSNREAILADNKAREKQAVEEESTDEDIRLPENWYPENERRAP